MEKNFMSLQEFEEKFSSENQCLDYLFHLRWPNGYSCPRCQHTEMWQIADYKYKCRKCGYQCTVTAGTMFQDTHLPLLLWFRAIWHISTYADKVTALSLQKELDLKSYHTALKMINKLKRLMLQLTKGKLYGTVELERFSISLSARKLMWIIVAVEINGKRNGRALMFPIDNLTSMDYTKFVLSTVKPGSKIRSLLPIDFKELRAKGYMREITATAYTFSRCRKVRSGFERWVPKTPYAEENITQYLVKYCNILNSLKTKFPFDVLLQRAIDAGPIPKAKNPLKDKKKIATDRHKNFLLLFSFLLKPNRYGKATYKVIRVCFIFLWWR